MRPSSLARALMPQRRLSVAAPRAAAAHCASSVAAAARCASSVAAAFDIDGVLLRGNKPLPRAVEALERLQRERVPYILLTNGGGEPEAVKARKLTEALGLGVDPRQLVLSHTPFAEVIRSQYADKKILVLGCRDVLGVARAYGAARVFDIATLARDEPLRYPFQAYDHHPLSDAERAEPFAAVFILHDPNSWGAELQIALDVICGVGYPAGSAGERRQQIPVYSSNADLVFAGAFPHGVRLACGAFTECLKLLFSLTTGGQALRITQCGKPTRTTFDFAARHLDAWAGTAGLAPPASPAAGFEAIYMVGDNPAADIRGARGAGRPWHSVLVRSGVFAGGDNDPLDPADHVVPGVADAVELILAARHVPVVGAVRPA